LRKWSSVGAKRALNPLSEEEAVELANEELHAMRREQRDVR
jgi:hypothetical protein